MAKRTSAPIAYVSKDEILICKAEDEKHLLEEWFGFPEPQGARDPNDYERYAADDPSNNREKVLQLGVSVATVSKMGSMLSAKDDAYDVWHSLKRTRAKRQK